MRTTISVLSIDGSGTEEYPPLPKSELEKITRGSIVKVFDPGLWFFRSPHSNDEISLAYEQPKYLASAVDCANRTIATLLPDNSRSK